jgi:hypothetical protein
MSWLNSQTLFYQLQSHLRHLWVISRKLSVDIKILQICCAATALFNKFLCINATKNFSQIVIHYSWFCTTLIMTCLDSNQQLCIHCDKVIKIVTEWIKHCQICLVEAKTKNDINKESVFKNLSLDLIKDMLTHISTNEQHMTWEQLASKMSNNEFENNDVKSLTILLKDSHVQNLSMLVKKLMSKMMSDREKNNSFMIYDS